MPRTGPRVALERRLADAAGAASGADDCWRWQGPLGHNSGYPRASFRCPFRGRLVSMSVHRLLMELQVGRPLARGELVLHRADCPKDCVNPAHLRLGTARENAADAKAAGRLGSRLTRLQVWQILSAYRAGLEPAEIAARHGVRPYTVIDIGKRRTHRGPWPMRRIERPIPEAVIAAAQRKGAGAVPAPGLQIEQRGQPDRRGAGDGGLLRLRLAVRDRPRLQGRHRPGRGCQLRMKKPGAGAVPAPGR